MRIKFDEYGREIPDPRPMALPAGFRRPETLQEQIQRLVRHQISDAADRAGFETFEEADDFDIDDGFDDPATAYEEVFDPVLGKGLTPAEFHANVDRYREEYLEAQKRYYDQIALEERLHGREDNPAGYAKKGGDASGSSAQGAGGDAGGTEVSGRGDKVSN